MTLKVWRGKKGTVFAECTACGSYGTAGHLEVKLRVDPEIQEAVDKHEAHMLTLVGHFKKAVADVAAKINQKAIEPKQGADQIGALQQHYAGQIALAHSRLPSPEGKVAEYINKCPWCEAVEEVDVEALPDDQPQPPWSFAVVAKPIEQPEKGS